MKLKFPAFTPINLKEGISAPHEMTLFHWQIIPNENQPRKTFKTEALEELAMSIKQCGILQPLIVKKISNDKFQIIAGERRWRAAKLINLLEIPVIIKTSDNEQSSIITLIENVQREDLNPIELAEGLHELYEKHDLSHEKIGEMIGKNRATVTNFLRLLSLPEKIRALLREKEIEIGHARCLLTLPEPLQLNLVDKIISEHLSVRQTEKLVKNTKNNQQSEKVHSIYENQVNLWTEKLGRSLSTKVSINMTEQGEGRVTIHFGSPDEIEWLVNKLS